MKMALCGPETLPPTDRKGASECGINDDQRQFPCFYAGRTLFMMDKNE